MKVIPFIYNHDPDEIIANTYIILDSNDNCLIVDPSKDYDGITGFIQKNKLHLLGILLTHSHFDHMRGIKNILKEFNDTPIYISPDDYIGLTDTDYNCSKEFDIPLTYNNVNVIFIKNFDYIDVLEKPIKVIFTPFHTKGSVCYLLESEKILISGDTLFKSTIGRTDLISSCSSLINSSLEKLSKLDDDIKIYPGHGPFSTIKEEKKSNKYLKYL